MNRLHPVTFAIFASFMALASFAFGQARTIVLDAGHGGYDRGGVPGQRIAEKDKTLDVALRLRRILQASGYRVIMTRDSDVFVPLPTRVAIANSYRGASFVSIHFNCASRVGSADRGRVPLMGRVWMCGPLRRRKSSGDDEAI